MPNDVNRLGFATFFLPDPHPEADRIIKKLTARVAKAQGRANSKGLTAPTWLELRRWLSSLPDPVAHELASETDRAVEEMARKLFAPFIKAIADIERAGHHIDVKAQNEQQAAITLERSTLGQTIRAIGRIGDPDRPINDMQALDGLDLDAAKAAKTDHVIQLFRDVIEAAAKAGIEPPLGGDVQGAGRLLTKLGPVIDRRLIHSLDLTRFLADELPPLDADSGGLPESWVVHLHEAALAANAIGIKFTSRHPVAPARRDMVRRSQAARDA